MALSFCIFLVLILVIQLSSFIKYLQVLEAIDGEASRSKWIMVSFFAVKQVEIDKKVMNMKISSLPYILQINSKSSYIDLLFWKILSFLPIKFLILVWRSGQVYLDDELRERNGQILNDASSTQYSSYLIYLQYLFNVIKFQGHKKGRLINTI